MQTERNKKKRDLVIEALSEQDDSACFVLIRCARPSPDGRMDVEFTYEGDVALASYLLENAQDYLDRQAE